MDAENSGSKKCFANFLKEIRLIQLSGLSAVVRIGSLVQLNSWQYSIFDRKCVTQIAQHFIELINVPQVLTY